MKTGQDIGAKMDAFIKEAGLEEEFKKLAAMFNDNLVIKGEETEELKEALHRAPDGLIDLIWIKTTGGEPDREMSRQQKEESLYEDILGYFESRFWLMDLSKINLLIQVAAYKPIGGMEAAFVMREFVPFGWAFAFLEDNSISFVVMKEIKDMLMTLNKPEMKEQIASMNSLRYMVRACLGLYGVCSLKQLQNVFMKAVGSGKEGEEEGRNLIKLLDEYLPYMEEEGELWLDDKYVVSPYLETKKDYKDLLRRQKQDYYVPDEKVIMAYGQGIMLIENQEYKAVFRLLNREIKDEAQTSIILEEVSEYVIREDWEIPEIMDCLYDRNVAFSSEKAAEKLVLALGKWLNVIRRWSQCGHCRGELITYISQNEPERETVKKIYPNDPCPCGSGKKYKKCCGRK